MPGPVDDFEAFRKKKEQEKLRERQEDAPSVEVPVTEEGKAKGLTTHRYADPDAKPPPPPKGYRRY